MAETGRQVLPLGEVLSATGGELVAGSDSVAFSGVSTDSRTAKADDLFFAIRGPRFDGHQFVSEAARAGAIGAVISDVGALEKSISSAAAFVVVRVADTVRALGDLAAHYRRQFSLLTVGVTGTNGKTTTKEMIAAAMGVKFNTLRNEGNFNNLIGVPLTLFRLSPDHTALVVELGMSAIGEITRLSEISLPEIGVVTNIGPAHLESMGDVDRVAEAKAELLHSLPDDGFALINADDPRVVSIAGSWGGRTITYGIKTQADTRGEAISSAQGSTRFRLTGSGETVGVQTIGNGGVYGALAALALARELGLPLDESIAAIEAVPPTPMRMEWIDLGGVFLINDAYNANPASVAAAVEVLSDLPARRRIAVLGDMLELGEDTARWHRMVGETLVRHRCDMLIAVGEASRHFVEGANAAGMDAAKTFWSSEVGGATGLLCELLQQGDLVLVKGSRAMGMERVVEGVRRTYLPGRASGRNCQALAGDR